MKMERTWLSATIIAIFAFTVTIEAESDGTVVFRVTKRLENGDILPAELWSTITIECVTEKEMRLIVSTRLENARITVYLANEDKNILALKLDKAYLTGYQYERPYGKNKELVGPKIIKDIEGEMKVNFPSQWLPKNVSRASASVRFEDDMFNYYGIFNRPISLEDTMVVEEFKKLKLFC